MRIKLGLKSLRQVITGAFVPTLSSLSFSQTTFLTGTASSGTIIGATGGSTITATGLPSGLTINGSARTWAWDGTGSNATSSFTLTETLAGATGSPKTSTINYTITTLPTLGDLSLSSTSFIVGTPSSGTINGATSGSTITGTTLPGGFTIDGNARTWAWDGTGSASSGSIGLLETLAASTNGTHGTTIGYTISSSTISAPAIAFDVSNGWTTGENPPAIQWTLPSDGTAASGDYLIRQYSTSSTFASGVTTEYHQLTSDDVITGTTSFSFASAIAGGLTYFRGGIGRGTPGSFTQQSGWSSTISDTLNAPATVDIVASTTIINAATAIGNTTGNLTFDFHAGIPIVVVAGGGGALSVTVDGVALTQRVAGTSGLHQIWTGAAVSAGNHAVSVDTTSSTNTKVMCATLTGSTNPVPTHTVVRDQDDVAGPWTTTGAFSGMVAGSDMAIVATWGEMTGITYANGTIFSGYPSDSSQYLLGKQTANGAPNFTGSGTHYFGIVGAQFHFS